MVGVKVTVTEPPALFRIYSCDAKQATEAWSTNRLHGECPNNWSYYYCKPRRQQKREARLLTSSLFRRPRIELRTMRTIVGRDGAGGTPPVLGKRPCT